MGLKSMHAEKQSEQPQRSVQDNGLMNSSHENSGADERARAEQHLIEL